MSTHAEPHDGLGVGGGVSGSRKRKMDARGAGEFEWEASKENVMPLKRGRNVRDLNEALHKHDSFQAKLSLEEEAKALENKIRRYDGDDPLVGWVEYIHWLETKMPEDTRKKFTVLEKCTRALKDNPRYRNDIRYIRLWIQYADLVSNPKDIFKYLYQNKIGEKVSLFYIGWAYVLETVANYPQAHKIYLKATQKRAEPQELLARKYKEFQRRMSRQWLLMNEESGADNSDEVNERRALENLASFGSGGVPDLGDSQRQQLRQQQAFARAQRVHQANAHKPVFIIYEDPAGHTVDPFDGSSGWTKLDTAQQQDKENEITPSAWNQGSLRGAAQDGGRSAPAQSGHRLPETSTFEVFVDNEFSASATGSNRSHLTDRSLSLRQRAEGVSTEEEILAQKPLKNFISDKDGQSRPPNKQKHRAESRPEKSCYNVEQLKTEEGETLCFEEVRARAYKVKDDRRRKQEDYSQRNSFLSETAAPRTAFSASRRTASTAVPRTVSAASPRPSAFLASSTASKLPPRTEPMERKSTFPAASQTMPAAKLASLNKDAQEDMTINTRVAMEDINGMFCSPERQAESTVGDLREEDPVTRKLHFSIFDDSADSIALNAQDQSIRQDPDESVSKQPFEIYCDDVADAPKTATKSWSQKRKPLGSRDDLARGVRLTNKDAILRAEKDGSAKDSASTPRNAPPSPPQKAKPDRTLPPQPARMLDPYTHKNRHALIQDPRVDRYLRARTDAVKFYAQKLPQIPCGNPVKRRFKKPIVISAGDKLTLHLVGLLGSGTFAYVFSAISIDAAGACTSGLAVKFEKGRHNLAWEFYITNKVRKQLKDERKLTEDEIPLPSFSSLQLFLNGALLVMKKGSIGTLHDLLNNYKMAGRLFPEVLTVYYGIKMLSSIALLHGAEVLHGDIKPDNWLMSPGSPASVLSTVCQMKNHARQFQAGDLYLIDYGRSIDLSLYPEGMAFGGNCHAKGFQCVEMLSRRPWTKQIDTFAFCGTVHCMLFGAYMDVKRCEGPNGASHWGITKPFKRYWQVDMWEALFGTLLNVESCAKQPSLSSMRHLLESYFVNDPSRQQELLRLLSSQERLLGRPQV